MSLSRSAISAGRSDRVLAAASSIARGMPSRRWQICTIASRSRTGSTAAPTSSARTRNIDTAAPSASVFRGSTRRTRSPSMSNGSREVANTRAPGHVDTMAAATAPAASSRCSQLSRINNALRNRSPATSELRPRSESPSISRRLCSVATSASGRSTVSSAANHTPPNPVACITRPTSSANRVLPTPPTPVRVTTRACPRWLTIDSTSSDRPKSVTATAGRLPSYAFADRGGRRSLANSLDSRR